MRLLHLLAILALFSSCRTVNKNLLKTKENASTETTVNTVNTQTTAATATAISTRTITEEIDTNQVIKGSVAIATGPAETLDTGGVIRTETEDQVIEIKKDAAGNIKATATVKDRKAPVKGKKTTIESSFAAGSSITSSVSDQKIHQDKQEKKDNVERKVDKKMSAATIAMWIFFILILVALIILVIRWLL
jgi:cobalamin biosynthesis Mg chelatase CobN